MKLVFLLLAILFVYGNSFAQKNEVQQQSTDYSRYIIEPKMYIRKDSTMIGRIDRIHPHLFESITEHERDSLIRLIHGRKQLFPEDSVTISEHLWIWKPLVDRLNYEDPHYRLFIKAMIKAKNFKGSDIHCLPFSLLVIEDTVIIDKSNDPYFKKGDQLVSINGTPVKEMLEYYYPDRYILCLLLQQQYHFYFFSHYCVEIIRDGEKKFVETDGEKYFDAYYNLVKPTWDPRIYSDYKVGYIAVNEFMPNNSVGIRKIARLIKQTQVKGYSDVIIDLRKNPGGSGHNFDRLISLFANCDTIPFAAGQKIRASEYVLKDYDFLNKDDIGKLVDMPDKYFYKKVPLKPSKYVGKVNYYVLMSRNTGSTAASFANMLQYNGFAKLVGEPLQHNALRYGEVTEVGWGISSNIEVYSTVQIDEFTKSPDGQVYPDIEIPYVAREYLQGGDPILEKLLEYIKAEHK